MQPLMWRSTMAVEAAWSLVRLTIEGVTKDLVVITSFPMTG